MRKIRIGFLMIVLAGFSSASVWAEEKNLFYYYPCGEEGQGVVVEQTTYNSSTGEAGAWVGSPTLEGNPALVKGEYTLPVTMPYNNRMTERLARERAVQKALHFYRLFFCSK